MCPPLCVGAVCKQRLIGRISDSAAQHDAGTQHPQNLEGDRHRISVLTFEMLSVVPQLKPAMNFRALW